MVAGAGALPDPSHLGAEHNIGYVSLQEPLEDLREADPYLQQGGVPRKREVLAKYRPARRSCSKRSKTSEAPVSVDGDADEEDDPTLDQWNAVEFHRAMDGPE